LQTFLVREGALGAAGSCSTGFGGSGTTLIAAEKTARRGYLMEVDPKYVDVTNERFQKLTGEKAVHAAANRTFERMRVERERQDLKAAANAASGEE
jgi:hypothetical protein